MWGMVCTWMTQIKVEKLDQHQLVALLASPSFRFIPNLSFPIDLTHLWLLIPFQIRWWHENTFCFEKTSNSKYFTLRMNLNFSWLEMYYNQYNIYNCRTISGLEMDFIKEYILNITKPIYVLVQFTAFPNNYRIVITSVEIVVFTNVVNAASHPQQK